jgi:dTDP-glucose pyrophosphorylase
MFNSQEVISVVEKPNISPSAFQAILNYIYTGIIVLDDENVYAILKAALELQLNELAQVCSKHVLQVCFLFHTPNP